MSNKSKGSKFEQDVANKLASIGYWATVLAGANHTGAQPCDVIAIKNNKAYLIDCKTLETKTGRFTIDRAEENQILAYKRFKKCGNDNFFYYILWNNSVYAIPMFDILLADKSINVNDYVAIWRDFYGCE